MRNGLIAAWKSKKSMKKGEQIFSNYGYQNPDQYEWYRKEWDAYYGPNGGPSRTFKVPEAKFN